MDSDLTWRYSSAVTHNMRESFIILYVSVYIRSQLEEAKELVRASIQAGIMCDLGSGNNIDVCVITRQGVDYIRPYRESQYKDDR